MQTEEVMKRGLMAALALLVVSCSDVEQVSQPAQAGLLGSDLTFLRLEADAYQAAAKEGSFWAVRGERRDLTLRYADTNQPFMEFSVGANSLLSADSVLISVQLDQSGDLTFHFAPAGLRFNALAPAVLRVYHDRKNPDIDADGDVDLIDTVLALQAGIWKRELPILPWLKIPSISLGTVEEARVYDFTSFGMAVD